MTIGTTIIICGFVYASSCVLSKTVTDLGMLIGVAVAAACLYTGIQIG